MPPVRAAMPRISCPIVRATTQGDKPVEWLRQCWGQERCAQDG